MKHRTMGGWIRAMAAGCLAFAALQEAGANNIRVANTTSLDMDIGTKSVYVSFTLSWDNAWRGSENWDAAWVFVKFRAPGSNDWQHATLSTVSGDHKPASGSAISAVPDGKGVFVYPASGYTGSVNYANTKLLWTYGSNGYSFTKGDVVEVSVHAIEMVYIPAGAFYLGSGGTESGHFYQFTDGSQSTNAFPVLSETDPIPVGMNTNNLYYAPSGNTGDGTGTISNTFPKGYAAFYCMKYETSQGQYADFLNKLTYTQATNRFPNKFGSGRHTITGSYTNYSAVSPDCACNYLSWVDGCAYAAWAALRPLTEMEFEKACRGSANAVPNEYAWGSASIYATAYTLTNSGLPDEAVSNPGSGTTGNALYSTTVGTIGGPARCGIFAASKTNPTRAEAGASYYGVMELTGNLWDRCVSVGNANGRVFRGTCGSGGVSASGYATNSDWPGYSAGQVTGGDSDGSGPGVRGGTYNRSEGLCISDRTYASGISYTGQGRNTAFGWRGVRQAP